MQTQIFGLDADVHGELLQTLMDWGGGKIYVTDTIADTESGHRKYLALIKH